MACTTILIGKKASYDGSTIVARNEDSGAGAFNPKKMVFYKREENSRRYKSVLSDFEITLEGGSYSYIAVPNAVSGEGIWAAAGINEKNVGMTATETITSNERVQGMDPLLSKNKETGLYSGIGEEDMVSLVLPYINSAREGVKRLGRILEEYGSYEMNAIAFHDQDEIWLLETIGGHNYIARKVPDDSYVVMPNQQGIDEFDFEDAYGEEKNFMCSASLKELTEKYHLDLSLDGKFNPRLAFGSDTIFDKIYNTPRAYIMHTYFNKDYLDENNLDYFSNNLPWALKASRKITIEDVKEILSNHYEGTKYDPYIGEKANKVLRPIGINRNNFLGISQIRGFMPDGLKSIFHLAYASNVFNGLISQYTSVDRAEEYFSNTGDKVDTSSFYWTNRIIAALADPHFKLANALIDSYQRKIRINSQRVIAETDKKILELNASKEEMKKQLEDANEKIAIEAKKHRWISFGNFRFS